MKFPHWQHFLSLESDFIETIQFVDIHKKNDSAFSVIYTKLLLSTCSEIDVAAKLLCKKLSKSSKPDNMNQYRKIIKKHYPDFHKVETLIPRYQMKIKPWSAWSGNSNPCWWKWYNKVKHYRDIHFEKANQKNVIGALSGLFCMLLYLYHIEFYSAKLEPLPEFFDYENMPGHMIMNPGAELPNIPR